MRTGRGFERLVNFSDAVVAIAMTLLVLPLVDITSQLARSVSLGELFQEHNSDLLSFLISFLVIWTLWSVHHRTMENFGGYDDVLLRLHMLWLFTIVSLPFTTQLLNSMESGRGAVPLYIGNLVLSTLALMGISSHGKRTAELLHTDSAEVLAWQAERISVVTLAILLLTLVLSLVFPPIGTFPLLLLILDRPIETLIAKLRGRRTALRDA